MNEATLNYLEGIAETDVQKKMIQIFSKMLDTDVDTDVVLKEILDYMKKVKQ